MIKILENLFNITNDENTFIFQKSGIFKYKLLKIKKENNNFVLVSYNFLKNTYNVEHIFSKLNFLNEVPSIAKENLERRILVLIYEMKIVKFKGIKSYNISEKTLTNRHNLLGDYNYNNFTIEQCYLADYQCLFFDYLNKEQSILIYKEKDPKRYNRFATSSESKNQDIYLNEELNKLNKNNVFNAFNKIRNFKDKNICKNVIISLNLDLEIIDFHSYKINDLLKFININSKYKFFNCSDYLKNKEYVSSIALFGEEKNKNNLIIEVSDILENNNQEIFILNSNNDLNQFLTISSLVSYLNEKELFLYNKKFLVPKLIEEKAKNNLKILNNQNNVEFLNKKVIVATNKISKLFKKIEKNYKPYNFYNLRLEEKINICSVNSIEENNLKIIIELFSISITKQKYKSISNNQYYYDISISSIKRHDGNNFLHTKHNVKSQKVIEEEIGAFIMSIVTLNKLNSNKNTCTKFYINENNLVFEDYKTIMTIDNSLMKKYQYLIEENT